MKFYLGLKNGSKQKFADCWPCWLCFYVRLFISLSLSLLFSTVRCLVLILSLVLLCWYSLSFSQLWHGSDPTLEIASMWAEPFSFFSFVLINWHSCWPRKWKGSFTQNFHFSFGVTFFCQMSIRGTFGEGPFSGRKYQTPNARVRKPETSGEVKSRAL